MNEKLEPAAAQARNDISSITETIASTTLVQLAEAAHQLDAGEDGEHGHREPRDRLRRRG